MKKLKVPELIPPIIDEERAKKDFNNYYMEDYCFTPTYHFDVNGFSVEADSDPISDDEGKCDGYYIYAFISPTCYLDDAIVQTDDFTFHTYAQWKKAVKEMTKQLIKRWKEWVNQLYKEENDD